MSMILLVSVCVLAVAVVVSFAILLPLASRVSKQAEMGQKARTVQCRLVPVARKVYVDAEIRNVITSSDLRLYKSVFALCPQRPAPPKK